MNREDSLTRRLFALGTALVFAPGLLPAAEVPRNAPELAIQMPGGQQLLLSQFRGKVVLLEFLHTTCPHCQESSALVEKLYKELGPRGFQPIGVAFNENAAVLVGDFVRQLGLTFPVGVAGRETVLEYLQHSMMQPLFVPQMIFVDRKGVIRAQHGGTDDDFLKNLEPNLRNQVETLLKEPAPARGTKSKSQVKKAATPASSPQSMR
jgi:thiol-disulfide isomerase/thioredoxin